MNHTINILVISTSLNPKSKSRAVAQKALTHLQSQEVEVDWIDLQDHQLPFCDGQGSNKTPVVTTLKAKIEKADGILLTVCFILTWMTCI